MRKTTNNWKFIFCCGMCVLFWEQHRVHVPTKIRSWRNLRLLQQRGILHLIAERIFS